MAELELRAVSKSFRELTVLRDISLRVPTGSFTILLGPSGCGKSTLLRIVAGLDAQTSGEVRIDGRAVDALPPAERDIAMVFQQYALYPHLTVRENLAFALKMRRTPREVIDERIAEAAQWLDIHQLLDRKPRDLSGGQRQRVAMGRAIVRKPKLFLFDEPLSNLDAQLRTAMRLELKKLHQRLQATILYVTHDQVEAMTLGDRIVLLKGGTVQQHDTPTRIYAAPANPFVASFIGTPPMNLWTGRLTRQADGPVFQSEGTTVPLPDAWPLPDSRSPQVVVLGIRPEAVALPENHVRHTLTMRLELIEDLGADLLLHGLIGRLPMVVRTTRRADLHTGADIAVTFPPRSLHLFIDDRRIEPDAAGT